MSTPYYTNSQANILDNIQKFHHSVQQDILQNDAQIKLLSSKIIKHDYDQTLLGRLRQHQEYLHKKNKQLQMIKQNHHKLQQQANNFQKNQRFYRKNLGNQYLQVSQERRRKEEQMKLKMIQQQKAINQQKTKALQNDYFASKNQFQDYKRIAQQQIYKKMQRKSQQKQQIRRQKEQYSASLSPHVEKMTNKDPILHQFCKEFMQNQKKMPLSYKLKGGLKQQSNNFHQIGQYQSKFNQQQELGKKSLHEQKDILRSYLQDQIQEKQRRKSYEKNQYLDEKVHTSRLLAHSIEGEQLQKMRKKQQQKKYDEQLREHTKLKSYSSDMSIPQLSKAHNPITNPISFKIGITNPYIIKQFESVKQKHYGDPNLKLRNLALIGNNSFIKQ